MKSDREFSSPHSGLSTAGISPRIEDNSPKISCNDEGTSEIKRLRKELGVANQELETSQAELEGAKLELETSHRKLIGQAQEIARGERDYKEQTLMLEGVINTMGDGLAVADRDGKFVLFNKAAEMIVGKALENVPLEKWSETYGILDPQTMTPLPLENLALARAIKGEEIDNAEFFVRNPRVAPEGLWIITTARPLRGEDGEIHGGVVTFRNISEMKKMEEKLRTSLREKETLLKEIHHRVKNNLNVISSLLDLQAHYASDKNSVEAFRESRNRIHSMAFLHEMLYRSVDLSTINLADYVEELSSHVMQSYQRAPNIRISFNVEQIHVGIDTAVPVGLILCELVSNCFKHAFVQKSEGNVSITLRAANETTNELIVSDNGVGFPKKFEDGQSRSLGLQLIKSLTMQIGGEIKRNSADNGTKFRVTFPVQRSIPSPSQ